MADFVAYSSGLESGFYDSKNGDRKYNTRQLSSIFDGIINDGVFSSEDNNNVGNHFLVEKPENPDMSVILNTGRGWFHHIWVNLMTPIKVTVNAADKNFARADVIILSFDIKSGRQCTVQYVPGKPATNPEGEGNIHKPINRPEAGLYQVLLAKIIVPANATSSDQFKIINDIGDVANGFPAWVSGPLYHVDASKMIRNWTDEFNVLFSDMEEAIAGLKQEQIVIPPGTVSSTLGTKNPIVLRGNDWRSAGKNGYHLSLEVPGLNKDDNPIISLRSPADDMATIMNMEDAYNMLYLVKVLPSTREGYAILDCWANERPEVDIYIQMLCVRK